MEATGNEITFEKGSDWATNVLKAPFFVDVTLIYPSHATSMRKIYTLSSQPAKPPERAALNIIFMQSEAC